MTDNDDQYAERLREVLHQEGQPLGGPATMGQQHPEPGTRVRRLRRGPTAVLARPAGGRRGGRSC